MGGYGMKRFNAALLTLVFIFALASPAAAAKAKAAVMRLQVAEGGVAVRDAAGVPIYYHKDMRLYSGYTVTTDSNGSAYILLDDEKAVKLDRNTSVLIKKSGRKLQVKLKSGQLIFNVTAPLETGEALEIRTSSMVVGIRGSSGIVNLREVIFITGHGVVYSGGKGYELSGGKGFRPRTGVFTAGISSLPSLYLKEVRDNPQLKASIKSEGIYNTDDMIAGITAAELREEEARQAARAGMVRPPRRDIVIPAFGKDDDEGGNNNQGNNQGNDQGNNEGTGDGGNDGSGTGNNEGAGGGNNENAGGETEEETSYTITWKSDEKTLRTDQVKKGETPAWTGDAPTKASDAQYSYTFDGWTPEIVPAEKDAAYTAVFTRKTRSYTITWKDDEGNTIDTTTVAYGETPVHDDPIKTGTDSVDYVFVGWDKEPAAVTGDAAYTAVFEATYNFDAIIPQPTGNAGYQVYYPTEGNRPISTAKEGEQFTFYMAGGNDGYEVRLNGVVLGEDNFYYSKELYAYVCTFIVPKDPAIEIIPLE